MIFNRNSRILKESSTFKLGTTRIPSTKEYTYLGISFSLNGAMSRAQNMLRQKSLRSFFALKRIVDIRFIKKSVLLKLFDSLILPIATYGCQTWLPMTFFAKSLGNPSKELLSELAKDPIEKMHLTFLKWILGVKRSTSNVAVWGETGRYPLAIMVIKQVLQYSNRLELKSELNDESLVRFALEEQKTLSLKWYTNLTNIKEFANSIVARTPSENPQRIQHNLQLYFIDKWNAQRKMQSKLSFYNEIKESFGMERYLEMNLSNHES